MNSDLQKGTDNPPVRSVSLSNLSAIPPPPPSLRFSFLHGLRVRWRSRLQIRQLIDHPVVSVVSGLALLAASCLPLPESRRQHLLVHATRRLDPALLQKLGRRALEPWLREGKVETWRQHRVGWSRYMGSFADINTHPALTTSLLLKNPGPGGEKGVIYSSFEFNWMKIVANHDARRLLNDYYLVGASSWSPSDHAVLANLCGLSDEPVFIGISNRSDMRQYRMFAPWIEPLPIMACDWVDPALFKPVPHAERTIDILMVAHAAYWKRHRLLFMALKKMRRNLNIVLIGRVGARGKADILAEAHAFGVRQQLTFLHNLEIDEVARYQCNAKVSLSLSKREGSCVAVTEALFADTPVGMMADAHIGAKSYINACTGRILRGSSMPSSLEEMLERSGEFSPRKWAMENISAYSTSQRLNSMLKEQALKVGRPWTTDITPMCWRYVPSYIHAEDKARMAPGREVLHRDYGIVLEDFVSENHGKSQGGR